MNNYKDKVKFLYRIWNDKFWGKFLQFFLVSGFTLIIFYFFEPYTSHKLLISILVGILVVFFTEVQKNNKINETFQKSVEDKIYRKLVSTNAIIPTRENKVSITARVLNVFKDESDYINKDLDKEKDESIDLVRILAYQNLILTPQYLAYFFYRKESVKKAIRIVVIPEYHHADTDVICQATLTYLFMSSRIGYETYIMPEHKYRKVLNEKIDEDVRKVMKGNPSITKTGQNGNITYRGEYTDFQANIETGVNKNIEGKQYWDSLNKFINNSKKIEPKTTGFQEHVKSLLYRIKQEEIKG